jgi:hypothetical protein
MAKWVSAPDATIPAPGAEMGERNDMAIAFGFLNDGMVSFTIQNPDRVFPVVTCQRLTSASPEPYLGALTPLA